jgi:hypothetical protein
MELKPVTFDTYRVIFLQNEPLLVAIPLIIRDFTRRLRLHSYCAMVFIIATMVFILAFPTLGSAMTGYNANVEPYVPDRNGNYIRIDGWRQVRIIVHDGWRINQTANFPVSGSIGT